MADIFERQHRLAGRFTHASWGVDDPAELQRLRLAYEKGGPAAVPCPSHVTEGAAEAEVLVVHFTPVSRALIASLPDLRVIGVARGGVENIDIDAATERGIMVFNVTGRNAEAVSDFTVGLMLAESRNIARSHAALMNGVWRKQFVNSPYSGVLKGKTVGLIGYGEIGRLVAKKLKSFDVTILVYDPYVPADRLAEHGSRATELKTLLAESDFVSVHARLTRQNERFINAEVLALMKPNAYFINTARAGLVDSEDLLQALREKRLGGAAVDVFEQEPMPADSPWLELDNVTLTSHLGGVTQDTYLLSMRMLYDNIADSLEGRGTKNLINKQVAELPYVKEWLAGNGQTVHSDH